MAHKNVGAIPAAGELTDADATLLAASRAAFDVVGDLLGRCRFKQAIGEAMRVVGLANKYISDQEPWKLKDDPARRDTVLHVALQVVQDCNTLLTPFLPHAAQKVFEALGGEGVWAAQPELPTVERGGRPRLPGAAPATTSTSRRPGRRVRSRSAAAGQADPAVHQAGRDARRDRPRVGPDRLTLPVPPAPFPSASCEFSR